MRGSCALGAHSQLTVTYLLLPGERHLRVEVEVDWQDEHQLLRYQLATRCTGAHARYGCPFGSVLRPQQAGGPQAEAMWEAAGSRWAAAQRDDGSGVALLAASNWGFSCRDGVLFDGGRIPTAAAADALWAPLPTSATPIAPLALPAPGSLVPAWACPTADGVELRLHEVAGGAGTLAVDATPVDALGRSGTRATQHAYGPYAILSLRLAR